MHERRTDARGETLLPPISDAAVVVTARGRESATEFFAGHEDPPGPDASVAVHVRLGTGHTLRGRVLAADGRALPGAVVVAASSRVRRSEVPYALLPQARCADDGTFRLDHIGEGAVELHVQPPGAAPTWLPAARVIVPDVREIDLVAPETGPLVGTVRDKDTGAPLPGARVWLDAPLDGRSPYALVGAVADASGTWELPGVPLHRPGHVWAERPGWVPEDAPLSANTTRPNAAGSESQRRDIALARGAVVEGRVTDGGAPVAGAAVEIRLRLPEFFDDQVLQTTADADGRWRIGGVGAGPAQVTAWRPESGDVAGRSDSQLSARGVGVEVPRRGTSSCDLDLASPADAASSGRSTRLHPRRPADGSSPAARTLVASGRRPALRVTGRILGPDGAPCSAVRLDVFPRRWSPGNTWSWTRRVAVSYATTPEGEFDVDAVVRSPGAHVLCAVAADGSGAMSGFVRVGPGHRSTGLVLRLRPPVVLRGRVARGGRPVAGALLRTCGVRDRPTMSSPERWLDTLPYAPIAAVSGLDGTFTLRYARRGAVSILAVAPDLAQVRLDGVPVPGPEVAMEIPSAT